MADSLGLESIRGIAPAISLTGDQNDYNPTGLAFASVLRIAPTAARVITGLVPKNGQVVRIFNTATDQVIVLAHESSSSSAANRFSISGDRVLVPGACAVLWYDETTTRWRLLEMDGPVFDSEYYTYLESDMVNMDPWSGWVTGTGANTNSSNTADGSHPGVVEALTGTTTSGRSAIAGINPYAHKINGGLIRFKTWIKTESNLSVTAQRYQLCVGFHNNTFSLTPNNAVLVRYKDDVNSGKWELACRNGGSESAVDTTVTVAASTWYRIEIWINAAGTEVKASVNGSTPVTRTTQIPTNTELQSIAAQILKTAGTTSRSVYCDRCEIFQSFSTKR